MVEQNGMPKGWRSRSANYYAGASIGERKDALRSPVPPPRVLLRDPMDISPTQAVFGRDWDGTGISPLIAPGYTHDGGLHREVGEVAGGLPMTNATPVPAVYLR